MHFKLRLPHDNDRSIELASGRPFIATPDDLPGLADAARALPGLHLRLILNVDGVKLRAVLVDTELLIEQWEDPYLALDKPVLYDEALSIVVALARASGLRCNDLVPTAVVEPALLYYEAGTYTFWSFAGWGFSPLHTMGYGERRLALQTLVRFPIGRALIECDPGVNVVAFEGEQPVVAAVLWAVNSFHDYEDDRLPVAVGVPGGCLIVNPLLRGRMSTLVKLARHVISRTRPAVPGEQLHNKVTRAPYLDLPWEEYDE